MGLMLIIIMVSETAMRTATQTSYVLEQFVLTSIVPLLHYTAIHLQNGWLWHG